MLIVAVEEGVACALVEWYRRGLGGGLLFVSS